MVLMNRNTTAPALILQMKSIFARLGIPETVFSDNGPPYNSHEYLQFSKNYNFTINTSSPDYPQSNGKVEAAVKAAKAILKKSTDPYIALMEYRASPLTGLDKSPAELLYGRKLRTTIPCRAEKLEPTTTDNTVKEKMQINKDRQKHYYDRSAGSQYSDLQEGEDVHVRRDKQWHPAKVIKKSNIRSYEVEMENGRTYRRNRRYLLRPHPPSTIQRGEDVI